MRRAWMLLALVLAAPAGGDEKLSMPPARGHLGGYNFYQFGLLRRGPSWTPTRTPATDSIQAGHMANIGRMAKEGYLLAAGPLLDGGDLRGIFIFRSDSVARLRQQVARDPAVSSGRLVLDLYPWLAPAGIGEPYRKMAARPGYRDSMIRHQLVLLKAGPKATAGATKETEALRLRRSLSIMRAWPSGELVTWGDLSDAGDLWHVLVYRTDSATAHRRALEDPAVKAGHLVAELHPWFAAYGTMPGDTLARAK